jgi:hypothetical protein
VEGHVPDPSLTFPINQFVSAFRDWALEKSFAPFFSEPRWVPLSYFSSIDISFTPLVPIVLPALTSNCPTGPLSWYYYYRYTTYRTEGRESYLIAEWVLQVIERGGGTNMSKAEIGSREGLLA